MHEDISPEDWHALFDAVSERLCDATAALANEEEARQPENAAHIRMLLAECLTALQQLRRSRPPAE